MKKWYQSKTLWVNAIAFAGSAALAFGVDAATWAQISVPALAIINIALRLITGESIDFGKSEPQ